MSEQQDAADRIVGIRRAVRTMITLALDDDLVASAIVAHNLSQSPGLAADALVELTEALDITLTGYAARSGRDPKQVWQNMCARLASGDDRAGQAAAEQIDN